MRRRVTAHAAAGSAAEPTFVRSARACALFMDVVVSTVSDAPRLKHLSAKMSDMVDDGSAGSRRCVMAGRIRTKVSALAARYHRAKAIAWSAEFLDRDLSGMTLRYARRYNKSIPAVRYAPSCVLFLPDVSGLDRLRAPAVYADSGIRGMCDRARYIVPRCRSQLA